MKEKKLKALIIDYLIEDSIELIIRASNLTLFDEDGEVPFRELYLKELLKIKGLKGDKLNEEFEKLDNLYYDDEEKFIDKLNKLFIEVFNISSDTNDINKELIQFADNIVADTEYGDKLEEVSDGFNVGHLRGIIEVAKLL